MTLCLVTGGGGFLGSHLVDALVAYGHEVRVLDNFSSGSRSNLETVSSRIEIIAGDVCDLEQVREATQDVELVFHHAASPSVYQSVMDPLESHRVCTAGTLHVLVAAREAGVRRVIYGASGAVYGDGSLLPRRENEPLRPSSPYAVSSLAGEHYCAAFSQVYGLETVRLRYFNVFGPRQQGGDPYAAVVPQFLDAMLDGKRPVIHGDGRQCRDFTAVDDVVQANLLAADVPRVSGRAYNIGSGRATSLLALVDRINKVLGTELRPIHTARRPGDLLHSQADITRAQADLGYCPCTDLEQALYRCIEYRRKLRQEPRHLRKVVTHPN